MNPMSRACIRIVGMMVVTALIASQNCVAADNEWRKGAWITVTETDPISLGLGWDSANHIKTSAKCVSGKPYQEASQSSRIYSSAVQDLSEVAKQLDISASVHVGSAIGGSASGSFKLANSDDFSSENVNIVVRAKVVNSPCSLMPVSKGDLLRSEGQVCVALAQIGSDKGAAVSPPPPPAAAADSPVGLTKEALQWLQDTSDPLHVTFRAQCGDGYINARSNGASLDALLTIRNVRQASRRSLEGTLSAEYGPVSASSSVASMFRQTLGSMDATALIVEAGGFGAKGDGKEKDKAQTPQSVSSDPKLVSLEQFTNALAGVHELAARAAANPVSFEIQVLPYEGLGNWPLDRIPPPDNPAAQFERYYFQLVDVQNVAHSIVVADDLKLNTMYWILAPDTPQSVKLMAERIQIDVSTRLLDLKRRWPKCIAKQDVPVKGWFTFSAKTRQTAGSACITEADPVDLVWRAQLPVKKRSFAADLELESLMTHIYWAQVRLTESLRAEQLEPLETARKQCSKLLDRWSAAYEAARRSRIRELNADRWKKYGEALSQAKVDSVVAGIKPSATLADLQALYRSFCYANSYHDYFVPYDRFYINTVVAAPTDRRPD
jgi:hypothetical protein